MPSFTEDRNVELSTIYYIEQQIASDWTNINVIKTYPNFEKVSVPVVAIRMLSIASSDRYEIGNRALKHIYTFTVDIFAKSDGQRLDLASYIRDKFSDNWTYYEHSHASGNPDSFNRVANGKVIWEDFTLNTKVDYGDGASVYDRFRHSITFNVKLEKNA